MSEPMQDSTMVYDPDMDPTDGYEAYFIVEQASGETLDSIAGTDGVRRVERFYSGRDAAVAFLRAPDFLELADLIGMLRNLLAGGDCCSKADVAVPLRFAVSPNPGPLYPSHWLAKPPVRALVRVRAKAGLAGAVLSAAEQIPHPPFLGGAIVAGSYDLLLEFGWDSFDAAAKALLGQVNTLPGVLWTETSLALAGP